MSEFVLDTTAVIEVLRGNEAAKSYLLGATRLYLPVITLGEVLSGLGAVDTRTERQRRVLDQLRQATTLVAVDEAIAQIYAVQVATLRSRGTPLPSNDVWIGAVAVNLSVPVLTSDDHFRAMDGVAVVRW